MPTQKTEITPWHPWPDSDFWVLRFNPGTNKIIQQKQTKNQKKMAYTQGLCSKIQANINGVAGMNAPALARQKVGVIDALMSPVNRMGFTEEIVPTNGKFRAVQINYIGQACDSDVDVTTTIDCTPDVTPEPLESLITTFQRAAYKMSFDETEMRKLCEADSVWVGQNIMRAMNAINVKVDKVLLASLVTLLTPQDLALFNTTGTPNPMAYATLINEFDKIGTSGSPLLVGGSNFNVFAKAQQIACCNTVAGVDLSQITSNGYFYSDPSIDGIVDAKAFFGWAPGVFQMVTWNKYVGDYAKRNDSFEHGTIVDPFTGLRYDLKTSYDDCAEKWFVELSLNWQSWTAPDAYCAAGYPMLQFNDCSDGPLGCPTP